eukprot:3198516-Amphidinium_carterae.1
MPCVVATCVLAPSTWRIRGNHEVPLCFRDAQHQSHHCGAPLCCLEEFMMDSASLSSPPLTSCLTLSSKTRTHNLGVALCYIVHNGQPLPEGQAVVWHSPVNNLSDVQAVRAVFWVDLSQLLQHACSNDEVLACCEKGLVA